jgi:hypothetical protein
MKAALTSCLTGALAAALLLPLPASAQVTGPTGDRITRVTVFGNEPCPRGDADEIVICARRPNSERYRIPEGLRDSGTDRDPDSESWAAQASTIEYAGRTGPQSCTPVGPGGNTGCLTELIRAARNDRRATADGEPGR